MIITHPFSLDNFEGKMTVSENQRKHVLHQSYNIHILRIF